MPWSSRSAWICSLLSGSVANMPCPRASGAKYLLVDALPTSRPILERLGFQHLTDTWACEWTPP